MSKYIVTFALTIIAIAHANTVWGQDACDSFTSRLTSWLHHKSNCCQCCGCSSGCCKVCKLVEEDREITTTCWGVKCEDFCVPGPGHTGCEHCETVCSDCEANAKEEVCAKPKALTWRDWLPNHCADLHTRKKLMKHTETKKVKGYKWVVENLCDSCRKKEKAVEIPADTTVPQPPKVSGAVLIEPVITQ